MVPESPGLIYLPWPGVGRVFGGKVQQRNASIDTAEVARFDAAAEAWWDPEGEARWLHRYNPVRLDYIRRAGCRHFGVDSLKGLRILDIGCGAGVLCEPLARLGADVVGVEPGESNIVMARRHACEAGLSIDYRCATAEALADAGERFDIVLAMEVVEHVSDAPAFLGHCAWLVKPGGLMILSTINRTLKSFVYAIVAAEYIFRLLPRGAHQWRRFVTPAEAGAALAAGGMTVLDVSGVTLNLRTRDLQLSRDTKVNYMLTAARPS
jgi:2-polyprenyl-6-hydroxyphenyl methylase / 3-demethylubiquinone-9 3-methyltransferase